MNTDKTERYFLADLTNKINMLWWQKKGLQYTTSGYGRKIPTIHMVQLPDDPIWRRVYCCIYSNSGTCYVEKLGNWVIIE